MKNKILKLSVIILAIAGIVSASLSAPTFAETDICNLKNAQGEYVASAEERAAFGCPNAGTVTDIKDTITIIINSVIISLSTVAVVAIILGGIQYMTSTGDPSRTKKAKDTIMYAVIGLIICSLSAIIVNFVILKIID